MEIKFNIFLFSGESAIEIEYLTDTVDLDILTKYESFKGGCERSARTIFLGINAPPCAISFQLNLI